MRILITAPNEFIVPDNDAELKIGAYYDCEPAEEGSGNQNRLFHALLTIYFISGCFSYPAKNVEQLKMYIKKHLGSGYIYRYKLTTGEWERNVKQSQLELDISEGKVRRDEKGEYVFDYELKSWRDYTKRERRNLIESLIAEMDMAGVQSKKYFEILEGIQKNDVWGGKELAAEAAK
jgi:hypothetical protein